MVKLVITVKSPAAIIPVFLQSIQERKIIIAVWLVVKRNSENHYVIAIQNAEIAGSPVVVAVFYERFCQLQRNTCCVAKIIKNFIITVAEQSIVKHFSSVCIV